jgi:cytochrome c551/c552
LKRNVPVPALLFISFLILTVACSSSESPTATTSPPPTATFAQPSATSEPPTATSAQPTATTSPPPTATSAQPSATSEPPTATSAQPSATSEPPTATVAPPTATASPPPTATSAPPSATTEPTAELPTANATETGEEEIRDPQALYTEIMGCAGCHNIDEPQTADNRGAVGPNHGNLYETAGGRVAGQDAETYVYNSIVDPQAYVVEGYQPIMPQDFAQRMSEAEIRALVDWLLDPNRSK